MSEILAVEYDYGAEEVAAYSLHYWQTSSVYQRQRFLARIGMPAVMTALGLIWVWISKHNDPDTELWTFSFYFGVIALYTLYTWLWYQAVSRTRLTKILSQDPARGLFGPTRLELRNDVLWRASTMSEEWVKWAGIESIQHDAHHIYFVIGSGTAIIVPRRAFTDQAGYEHFVARATELWRRAQ